MNDHWINAEEYAKRVLNKLAPGIPVDQIAIEVLRAEMEMILAMVSDRREADELAKTQVRESLRTTQDG